MLENVINIDLFDMSMGLVLFVIASIHFRNRELFHESIFDEVTPI